LELGFKNYSMIGIEEKNMVIGLFPFLSENPVIFDVGSNKGHFTDVVLEEFADNCKLHLFEPNKKLLSFTEIKYEYRKNIIYNNIGLWKYDGETDFFYFENENNELSSFFPAFEWSDLLVRCEHKQIKTTSVDNYCLTQQVNKIDFLKIDVEGAEVGVISGCERLLEENKISIIQIEYSPHYKRANYLFQNVIDIVSKYGYKIYHYEAENYWEVKDFVEDYRFENFIITKEEIHNYSAGWNGQFILNTSELPKFDLCLEVGAFEGLTTKYMAEKMLNEGGRVVVVDHLLDYYIEGDTEHPVFKGQYQRFKRNTRGLPIELYRNKSEVELPKMNALRFDFIYLDGDHRKDAVYFDGVWSFAICKTGGYILFDDYTWREETTEGIDKFLNEFAGSLEIIRKEYQVLIRKTANQYNDFTISYYQ